MSDIFLSYAREDSDRAKAIAEELTRRGWSVWWDRKIPPGKSFSQVVQENLDAARCVVVLWSKASVRSEWVEIEASTAKERGILVPALIEDVAAEIPLEFRRTQAASLVDWRSGQASFGFDALVGAIRERAPVPPDTEVGGVVRDAAGGGAQPERTAVPSTATPRPSAGPSRRHAWVRPGAITAIGVAILVTAWQLWPESDTSSGPAPEPVIEEFQPSTTSVTSGREVTLTWRTSDADRVVLEPGGSVALSGSMAVTPAVTTEYTLVALGPGGESRRSVQITVAQTRPADPPTATLTIEPASIVRGDAATLRWSTSNATSVRLNGESVGGSDNRRVTPTADETYRLVVAGPGGTVEREASVRVRAADEPGPGPTAGDVNIDFTRFGSSHIVDPKEAAVFAEQGIARLRAVPTGGYCPEARPALLAAGTYRAPGSFLSTARSDALNACNGVPLEFTFDRPVRAVMVRFYGAASDYLLVPYDASGQRLGSSTAQGSPYDYSREFSVVYRSQSANIARVTFGSQASLTMVLGISATR